MENLLIKIDNLEKELDNDKDIIRIKELNKLLKDDKELFNNISKYRETNDNKYLELINYNKLYNEYISLEDKINIKIIAINEKFKDITNISFNCGNCQKGCSKNENN